MRFSDYWQQFEHTGSVEDYLNYLYHTDRACATAVSEKSCPEDCTAQGYTDLAAGEGASCRNPCM